MTHILHLPNHVLESVFEHIKEGQDLKVCRFVCLKWNPSFTKRLFEKTSVATEYIKHFIQLNKASEQTRLTPIGQFIKTLAIVDSKDMTFDDFVQLVNYCPNVKRLVLYETIYKRGISRYLLEIDDSIKWNLHCIEGDYMPRDELDFSKGVDLELYYKYKDSIKKITAPPDIEDLQFLKSFPVLGALSLPPSLTLTTTQDFIFILDSCHYLSSFSAWFELEEDINLPFIQDPYPSLTRLTVQTTKSSIPKIMVDYITKRFVNLSNISLAIFPPHLNCDFIERYCQLLDFFFRSPKQSLKLKLRVDKYGHNNRIRPDRILTDICECFNKIFQLPPVNSDTYNSLLFIIRFDNKGRHIVEVFLERSTRKMIRHNLGTDAYVLNPTLQTDQPILDIDRLRIDGTCIYITISPSVYSFFQKCYRLQALRISLSKLQSFHGYTYNSLRDLHLYSCNIHVNFFRSLSVSCPNLKELRLCRITTYDDERDDDVQVIDLRDMTLQSLLLDLYDKLLIVTSYEKISYYRSDGPKYIELVEEEAMDRIDYYNAKDRYYIYYQHVDEFVLGPELYASWS